MRSPFRQALIWLAALALGIILIRFGFSKHQWVAEDWPNIALGVAGVTLTPIAAVMAIWALILALGRVRLLAGHNVMARWHLSASAWERFCKLDQDRTAASGLHNDYNAAKLADDRGVDVIAGTKSALVGDSYHALRRGGNPALHGISMIEADDPGCIEFAITYYRKNSPGVRMALRLPFPPEARRDAARVFDHFAPLLVLKPAIALRHPGRTIGISLGLAAISATVAAWGFSEAIAGGERGLITLMAAITGSIIAPAALILALATFLLARRQKPS